MDFNLIGAGRLGMALAYALIEQGATLKGICNATYSSTQKARERLQQGIVCHALQDLPPATITFITVPDEAIRAVASDLAERNTQQIVIHCSGALSAEILSPLAEKGVHTASMHPVQSFVHEDLQAKRFNGCYVAIEGQPEAIETITPLMQSLGAITLALDSKNKALYHAAAVFASNYAVTLQALSRRLFEQSGIESKQASGLTYNLAQSTLNNIKKQPQLDKVLTGPLARGDLATVTSHLKALNDAELSALYRQLGLQTLPLTQLSSEQREIFCQLLNCPLPAR